MKQRKIKPEIEVFERGHINNALKLEKKGLIDRPIHFDFVMGVPGAIPGEIDDLIYLVSHIPPNSTWTVAGIGKYELSLAVHAILMGGHVRVGFEDNIYFKKGELAKSNAQLVERIAKISIELGREVARPEEARKILNIGGEG
jgi:3-keto-5-aminohexanoate cleavage enzyme